MSILQTSPGAAPIPGFISFIVIEVGVYFICSTFIIKEMRKGETFDYGNCEPIPDDNAKKLPHFALAMIPLVVVFLLFLSSGIRYRSSNHPDGSALQR